ncbi:MAG: hypothetical protein EB072_20620, partial [Betaproteobacteria bacterium]|nr:hypothetical protein [Betaproteobacteria bacterium]
SAYRFKQTGIRLDGYAATGIDPIFSVALQNDADGTVLVFPGGTASAKVSAAGMSLGGATVSASAPAAVSPTLSAYVAPPSGPSTAGVFLGQGANFTAASSGLKLYGAAGIEVVALSRGTSDIEVDQLVERLQFNGLSTAGLSFQQTGNRLLVFEGSNLLGRVPLQTDTDGTLITTTDGTMQAKVNAAGMRLGGTLVSSAAPSAVVPLEVDATLKAPSDRVNVLITGAGSFNASTGDITFNLASITSTYSYAITGFGAGDSLVGPTGISPSITNDSFADGVIELGFASSGNLVKITLTGLTASQDGAIFGASDINTVFGAGTLT